MSKRNFILLIIILALTIITIFGFLYFKNVRNTPPGETNEGTNFISQFSPFGNGNSNNKPPQNTGNEEQNQNEEQKPELKLTRVSSMGIAGFTVFNKERLIDIPVETQGDTTKKPYDFGSTTIKEGSSGESVEEIQRFLNKTLSLNLVLNGLFNTETITAIKKWQSANGLVADGVIGAKTKIKMYASIGQKMWGGTAAPPPTEFTTALRYVDRVTGNIYQTFIDKITERKFSTTIIPKVYDAYFGNNGESVLIRYLKGDERTIETFFSILPKELLGGDTTEDNEIKGSFLPNNVKDISISPDTSKAFYLWENGENMIGTILDLTNSKKTQIFDSPFTEWLSFWPNSNTITLSTKPSVNIPGYMYKINTAGKNLSSIIGNIGGLTTLSSPDGKLVAYADSTLSLRVYDTDTRNSELLGIKTLVDKCVWGKLSDTLYCAVPKAAGALNYPDSWYQGEVSFNDEIWKIDNETGNATLLIDPIKIDGGQEIDGIKLALDDGEGHLFFINKKDSYLWKLDLK